VLFVGDDWAEDHHDVEVMDASGRPLARARLEEGIAGMIRLHALIGQFLADAEPSAVDPAEGPDEAEPPVLIGIETDRGPWVQALIAAGYRVYPINPMQVARYRERHRVSGAKSDPGDAHVLADMVRTDAHQLRPAAGDSDLAEAVKVVTRAHKTLIWERTRHVQRLRNALREFFPAALVAFEDLSAPDTLELLAKAPDPVSAARLSTAQIGAALTRARRRHRDRRATAIRAALRTQQLGRSPAVSGAYAATVRAQTAILTVLAEQITTMEAQVEAHFGQHPDAEIYTSQPGLGVVLGARVLAEFGDDPARYSDARARKNYAGTSPITRASGKKRLVLARYVHNDRLIDALGQQAFCALNASPGARAYYDRQRARGLGHRAALRQLANRLVGILHGCLKSGTHHDEDTAWQHHTQDQQPAA
jgi:transposase